MKENEEANTNGFVDQEPRDRAMPQGTWKVKLNDPLRDVGTTPNMQPLGGVLFRIHRSYVYNQHFRKRND